MYVFESCYKYAYTKRKVPNQAVFPHTISLIRKTCLIKYAENFTTKNDNFQIKNSDIFQISDQNIDYGYSLEPPHRGGSNEYPQSMFWAEIKKLMYTPVNPSLTI